MVAAPAIEVQEAAIRPALSSDAEAMARLIEIAGAGIPSYLWSTMAEPGETPLDVGIKRALRQSGSFSYTNGLMATVNGKVVGMVLAYPLNAPTPSDLAALGDIPLLFRPFIELEYEAPGSFYINALAVFLGWRDRGLGSLLLEAAEDRARQLGCRTISVQAFSQNPGAVRLYQRHGFKLVDERPLFPHPCYPYDESTVLLVRDLPEQRVSARSPRP